jgi:hypothetical protein
MNENDYITASNLSRLRVITDVLRQMIPTKDLSAESIDSFLKWAYQMADRHYAKIETKP